MIVEFGWKVSIQDFCSLLSSLVDETDKNATSVLPGYRVQVSCRNVPPCM